MASEDLAKIQQQIRILKDSDSNNAEKANAARSLENLADSPEKRLAVECAGGVPPLVELLNDGDDFAKGQAAEVLYVLAKDRQVAKTIVACGGREALEASAEDPRDDETVKWGSDLARKALKRLPEETKAPDGLTSNSHFLLVELAFTRYDQKNQPFGRTYML